MTVATSSRDTMSLTLTQDTHAAEPTLPAHRRPDRSVADIRLPPVQRWVMLAVLVTVFLTAGERPVWQDPFDIDRAIWFSYAPIPLLVLGGLFISQRLSLLTWVLNTGEIITAKFVITYLIAIPLWATTAYQPPPAAWGPPTPAAVATPPPVTPWPDASRTILRGRVVDAVTGDPLPDALVYVASGLEDIVFERPAEPVVLDVGEHGFAETITVAQRWQPLVGSSRDGQLHPLRFTRDHEVLLMTSVLAEASASPIPTTGLGGLMKVTCVLHGESAQIAVFHHAHHTRSEPDGSFVIERVPDVPVTLAAWHPTTGTASILR
jgi:hypothetical protein